MSKAKKIFGCILVALVIWAISRFVPGCISVIDPSSVGLRAFAFAAMLPIGWIVADKISKGRFYGCIRVNLYIFAFIEAIGILQNISYILQNWSYTGQYTMDMHGIYYSDYPFIFGGAILFSVVYIALCIYLATKTTVLTDGKTIPAINEEISSVPMSTVEAEPEKVSEQPEYIAPKKSKQRYCKYCGGAIDSGTKKCTKCGKQYFRIKINKHTICYGLLILMIIGLLCANLYHYFQYRDQISELQITIQSKTDIIQSYMRKVNSLEKEISGLNETISFFDKHVVFVVNDGTNKYHKYSCSEVAKDAGQVWWKEYSTGKDYGFWAYNLEAAKSYGYSPCPECCG